MKETAFKKFRANQNGSFTIEASLMFPILLILTIIFIFFALFIYQKVVLHHQAAVIAERAAFVWNNTNKDPVSGVHGDVSAYDGLYWRLTDDRMLESLFEQAFTSNSPSVLQLGAMAEPDGKRDLTEQKLYNISRYVPEGMTGTLSYEHVLYKRVITVNLESSLKLPAFVSAFMNHKASASAEAYVVEPAEFIRSVDLIRVYGAMMKDQYSILKQKQADEKSR
jgi:hypothetical protein